MTLGEKIKTSRKQAKMTSEELSGLLGISNSAMWKIENDLLKGGADEGLVVKISEILCDRSILTCYLENNPVYQSVIPKIFTDLNNIRRDPAIIFSRFASEAEESVEAARILADIFSNADPEASPNFKAVLKAKLEQIVDVQRCAEILFLQLTSAGVITDEERLEVHAMQQRKCIEKGHHKDESSNGKAA